MIYEYLLLPSTKPSSAHSSSVTNLRPDYHTYYSSDTNTDPFTLTVRTIDPYLNAHTSRTWRRRSTYHVRTGESFTPTLNAYLCAFHNKMSREGFTRAPIENLSMKLIRASGPFLTSTVPTTYRVLLSPYTAHLRHTVPSLLGLNRQIHAEASKVLYGSYTWSFHTNIESAVPFFNDLTETARGWVRSVQVTKKALPYTKEFDRAEWASLCSYLASNMNPQTLSLSVVAGRPGDETTTEAEVAIPSWSKNEFEILARTQKEWNVGGNGGVDLEWVEQLMQIRGLRDLRVKALVEHCPLPRSEAMSFWVALSRSLESGSFEDWVRQVMVGAK